MTDLEWIKQYEDHEERFGKTRKGKSKLFTLTMRMPETALKSLAARAIVDGKVKRIT